MSVQDSSQIDTSQSTSKGANQVERHEFALILNQFITPQLKAILSDLEMNNFSCLHKKEGDNNVILLAHKDDHKILAEAERQKVLKVKKAKTPEKEEVYNKMRAEQKGYLDRRIIEAEKKKPFKQAKMSQFEGGTVDTILNQADRSRLIYIILNKLKLNDMYETTTMFSEKAYPRVRDETLIFFLKRFGYLVEITPLHSKARGLRQGVAKISKIALKSWLIPTELVREYYGDHVAIYFEWMNFFIKWLLYPGLAGLVIRIINPMLYEDTKDSALNSLYSIVMSVWAVLFVIFWKRKCRSFYVRWDNYPIKDFEEDVRKEFVGELQMNPVTGRVEPMFSGRQRLVRYLESFLICAPFFCVVVFVVACFLNLTGIVNANTHGGLFHIEFLADMTKKDAIFDVNTNMAFIPSILQSVITLVMNQTFRRIAMYATARENHKTQTDYNNSLIIKRFAFEFIDFYLYLFYIGFYSLDIVSLRKNLLALFMVDQVRRFGSEIVVPYIMLNREQVQKKLKAQLEHGKSSINNDSKAYKNTPDYIVKKELEELEKDDHEPFDEYLEMIITFGYITLFATAFPLASTISVVFIYLEARADLFKLEKLSKRPVVHKTYSIGSWQYVLEFIAFLSIFSNIILFTFASDQIDHLIPTLKQYTNDSSQSVLAVFTIEHVLIVVAIGLRLLFDQNPRWVDIFFKRQRYRKTQKKYGRVATMIGGNIFHKGMTLKK